MSVHSSDTFTKTAPRKFRCLADYETVMSRVLSLLARDTQFYCEPRLDHILAEHRRLVVVFSHASPLSWVPAPCLLNAHFCARGGGQRRPISIVDRFFYSVPGLKQLATYITQSSKPLSFEELVHHFETLDQADLVLFPEGSNCFFGDPSELQPFRSIRFLELAIRAKTPLLLCVHRGSEDWGQRLSMDQLPSFSRGVAKGLAVSVLGERVEKNDLITISKLPKPMRLFAMSCELYHPALEILSDDPSERKIQVSDEAERVHRRMQEMLLELDRRITS